MNGTVWDDLLKEESQWQSASVVMNQLIALKIRRHSVTLESPPSSDSGRRNSFDPVSDVYTWEQGKGVDFRVCRFEIDYDNLTKLFFRDETTTRRKKAYHGQIVPTKGVLDVRRIQNIEISLKGLGVFLNPDIVALAVRMETEKLLDVSIIQVILQLLPTQEEASSILTAPRHALSASEIILVDWLTISRFKRKLESLQSFIVVPDDIAKIQSRLEKQIRILHDLAEQLNDPPTLRCLFALCLKMGNYVNYYHRRVQGFNLESFEAFRNTVAFQGSTNLLKVISQIIDTQYPSFWTCIEKPLNNCSDIPNITPDESNLQVGNFGHYWSFH